MNASYRQSKFKKKMWKQIKNEVNFIPGTVRVILSY